MADLIPDLIEVERAAKAAGKVAKGKQTEGAQDRRRRAGGSHT
jgi:hypothetical protein